MAGVGFELRKLFQSQGLFNSLRAYAFSSLTTIGPMVLCMTMIVVMQVFMSQSDASFMERELFLSTVVYCFIFSVLLTGGLSMVLTRFIADMMYQNKYEHLLSSYYGSIAVCMPFCAIAAWWFLRGVDADIIYQFAVYIFFAELIVIWLQSVYLSALKEYTRIVKHFFIGIGVSLGLAWLLLHFTSWNEALCSILAMDIGFFALLLLSNRHFEQSFPEKSSRLYFTFLNYFKKYPSLFFIGTFFYSGVYIHSFVYWFGPKGFLVADRFQISPFFDLPVFYAYLTVIPTLVTFVVSVETSFYEKFRMYYTKILAKGTLVEIERAKKLMQKTLVQEISFIMELQLLFSLISLAIGVKILPMIGFTMDQLDTFSILVLGYYMFIIAFIVMLLLLYYDDRKGVLIISGLLVVMNGSATWVTMQWDLDGFGMFIASFFALVIALIRMVIYVRSIDYYTFCSQPITVYRKEPFWKRWPKKLAGTFGMLLAVLLVLSACDAPSGGEAKTEPVLQLPEQQRNTQLIEDKRLYEQDIDDSVSTLYITVLPSVSQGNSLSWYSLNKISERLNKDQLDIIVQEGALDGSGPTLGSYGFNDKTSNATIALRGNTSRLAIQKSYKIRLNNQSGLWKNQRVLNLNKHPNDESRIRNKLSFDLMETLPDMASLRTQFVQLYVKDLSEGREAGATYENYGLFTHVENPNELFLRNHKLDPYGLLYKATQFEFFRYPEALKSQSDPAYNRAAFEAVLEIQGREDHDKLLRMLDDVNNSALLIDEVFDQHFDRDNFLTWMACNILMDNMDTNSQNYLLYSPLNSEKWYFIPWDYDGGWGNYDNVPRIDSTLGAWQYGISNYWANTLHKRFFQNPDNVEALGEKIRQLEKQFTPERLTSMIDSYGTVVMPFLQREPDIQYLNEPLAEVEGIWDAMAYVPATRAQSFFRDLEKPMPIYLGDPQTTGGQTRFVWERSFDLQGDPLTYDFSVAADPAFSNVVVSKQGLEGTETLVNDLEPGTYYWKVIIRDAKGNLQEAFDEYEDVQGDHYHGLKKFEVSES